MGGSMQERISVRAYRIWEEKGRPHGSAEDHWHQAKREIEEEDRASGAKTSKPRAPRARKPAAAARSTAASTAEAEARRATKSKSSAGSQSASARKSPAGSKPASKKKS